MALVVPRMATPYVETGWMVAAALLLDGADLMQLIVEAAVRVAIVPPVAKLPTALAASHMVIRYVVIGLMAIAVLRQDIAAVMMHIAEQ
jgi:hypothetical protein